MLNAVQQLAAAIGVAVLGTVFFAALPSPGYVGALEQVLVIVAGLAVVAIPSPCSSRATRGKRSWGDEASGRTRAPDAGVIPARSGDRPRKSKSLWREGASA
ncbi:MAG: hypothetical protein U0R70_00805 [Solirubrobacteraceae bacterium]